MQPWQQTRFGMAPRGADKWESLGSGWWVRTHGKARVAGFHPCHRSTPFDITRLSPQRHTVIFHGSDRQEVSDQWSFAGRSMLAVNGTWKGYTFFRINDSVETESTQSGHCQESSQACEKAAPVSCGYLARLSGSRARGEAAFNGAIHLGGTLGGHGMDLSSLNGEENASRTDPSLSSAQLPLHAGAIGDQSELQSDSESDGGFVKVNFEET